MASPEAKSTVYEGIIIRYTTYNLPETAPNHEALVFVHGWTCDSTLWYLQSPLYTKYPAVLIDLPGHGKSDKPTGVDYNVEFFARSVSTVLDAEGITAANIVAHSLGGAVSTMTLRLFPAKVKSIIYISSFWKLPKEYMTVSQRRAWKENLATDAVFMGMFNERWTDKSSPDTIKRIQSVMLAAPLHVRTTAAATDSIPHAWRSTEVYPIPSLHVTSTTSPPWDPEYKNHLPAVELELWEGHSIFLFMEDGDRFNESAERFLKKHALLQAAQAAQAAQATEK